MKITDKSRIVGMVRPPAGRAFSRTPVIVSTDEEILAVTRWDDQGAHGDPVVKFIVFESIPVRPCVAWVLTGLMDDGTQYDRGHFEKAMNHTRKPVAAFNLQNGDRILLVEDPNLIAFRARWVDRMLASVPALLAAKDLTFVKAFVRRAWEIAPVKDAARKQMDDLEKIQEKR